MESLKNCKENINKFFDNIKVFDENEIKKLELLFSKEILYNLFLVENIDNKFVKQYIEKNKTYKNWRYLYLFINSLKLWIKMIFMLLVFLNLL